MVRWLGVALLSAVANGFVLPVGYTAPDARDVLLEIGGDMGGEMVNMTKRSFAIAPGQARDLWPKRSVVDPTTEGKPTGDERPLRFCFFNTESAEKLHELMVYVAAKWQPATLYSTLRIKPDIGCKGDWKCVCSTETRKDALRISHKDQETIKQLNEEGDAIDKLTKAAGLKTEDDDKEEDPNKWVLPADHDCKRDGCREGSIPDSGDSKADAGKANDEAADDGDDGEEGDNEPSEENPESDATSRTSLGYNVPDKLNIHTWNEMFISPLKFPATWAELKTEEDRRRWQARLMVMVHEMGESSSILDTAPYLQLTGVKGHAIGFIHEVCCG